MTAAERREANRLRAERWRRARGIMPRKPASKPWLAEGVSRSTWYRRGNRVTRPKHHHTDGYNRTINADAYNRSIKRASAFTRQLQAELAEAARCQAIAAAIIGEMAATGSV